METDYWRLWGENLYMRNLTVSHFFALLGKKFRGKWSLSLDEPQWRR
jgi:hypothetical protein